MMAEGRPLVSVIMPAYNAAQHVAKSIASVQNQTIADWELIVLDDGSSDATVQTVAVLAEADARIRLYENVQNKGAAGSRNRGLELCRGEYVAFLDSDDLWRPEKLEKQLDCFQKTGADLVYTAYAIVSGEGRQLCRDYLVPASIDFSGLLKENVIGCSTVMLSAKVAAQHRFTEKYYHEDYVLWLEILRAGGKAVGVEQVLTDYWSHSDSKAGNKKKAAWERWRIYRDYLKFPMAKSAWYFACYALASLRKYKKV